MQKFLKIIGILVLTFLLLPAVLPHHFSLSRTIQIQAPAVKVFAGLIDLNIYNKWSPFPEGDPSNQTQIEGTGVGSSLSWQGEKTGEGKMTIASIDTNDKVTVKMEFYKPMAGEALVKWIVKANTDSISQLTWTFDQDFSYFSRYFGLIAESMMGKHFERGLSNYKTLVESEEATK